MGSLLFHLILLTVLIYGFDSFDPVYGRDLTWRIIAFAILIVAGLSTVGFAIGLAFAPRISHEHRPRLLLAALLLSFVCAAVPYCPIPWLSIVLVPAVPALLSWSTMVLGIKYHQFSAAPPGPHCPNCGYSLIGLATAQCPECGQNVRP
jgi:hypothetical protein